ncbi:hypothetical protein evm_013348 [Chilo suppressalis]|nr:hypothetical protein evm_013348 [Chilo suppressalis]
MIEVESSGNYTCSVRGASGASDAVTFAVVRRAPPLAPAPRLLRADTHALHLAWDPPNDNGAAILGYTVQWSRAGADADAGGERRALAWVGAGSSSAWVRGLSCGALYRVTLRAHNALGASPAAAPLRALTLGDKAKPAPGKEFVWANSSSLRLNLLAWRARCPVAAWAVSLRPAPAPATNVPAPAAWTDLLADGESALVSTKLTIIFNNHNL